MKHFLKSTSCLIGILLLLAVSSNATQTGQIQGSVNDKQGDPIVFAKVYLEGTDHKVVASEDGSFVISSVRGGTYTMAIESFGYLSLQSEISITENDTLFLTFVLEDKPFELEKTIIIRSSLVGNKDQLFKIPGSAHYLEQEELQKFEFNDIHQVLRQLPGINIQEEDGYGLRPNIGFRGTGVDRSQKVSIMEDGILISPAPYSASAAYYFPTVGRMHGVEVRKGSSQVKYGPYTTGGALNLLSTIIPSEFGGRLELFAGQDAARRVHATVGKSVTNFGFVLETYQDKVDGFKKLDGGGNTGYDKKDYMIKVRLNTDKDVKFYQQIEFKYGQTDEISHSTYLGLTDSDFEQNPYRRYSASQEDLMDADHEQIHLRHFIKLSDALDVTTTLYRNDFSRNWYKLDRVRASVGGESVSIGSVLSDPISYAAEFDVLTGQSSPNEDALMVKANNREYYARGVQSVFGLKINNHDAEIGIRFHEDQEDRIQWVDSYRMTNGNMMQTDAGALGSESNRISKAKAWAGFVELNLSFGQMTVVPGFRYENIKLTRDDYGTSDPNRIGTDLKSRKNEVNILIPGIGLDYQFSQRVSTFGGIHKGFAPPGSSEGTEPEESINYEMGVRYRDVTVSFQGVLFFNNYSNLLGADLSGTGGTGSGDLFNGGEVENKGVELSLNYMFTTESRRNKYFIPVNLAYTFTDGQFKNSFDSDYGPWSTVQSGDKLPYLPRHQFSIGSGLETDKVSINLNSKYVSKMRTKAGQGDFVETESTDSHFLIGASVNYVITGSIDLFGSVRNLTDATYIAARRPAGVRPGLPRTFSFGIRTNF